jgi:hypothetical protein
VGSGAKLQFLRLKPSGDHHQENRINRALQYEHFRLKLFEIENLHRNPQALQRAAAPSGGGIDWAAGSNTITATLHDPWAITAVLPATNTYLHSAEFIS